MIGYITVGTNNLAAATKFYDELLALNGATRIMDLGRGYMWGVGPNKPGFAVMQPFDGAPATVGNGVMISLVVDSPAKVDAMHAKALGLGAKDEGPAGKRGDSGFYGGYFRDLDGNKLAIFCMGAK
jgi:catechol 2,3-dioxygenase-like lactoylglutathione lyase family enzyme